MSSTSGEREPLVPLTRTESLTGKNFYFAPARTRSNTVGVPEDEASGAAGSIEPATERPATLQIEGN